MKSRCKFIAFSLLIFSLPLMAQDVYPCIWRNPERTMRKIFPTAKEYKSKNVEINAKQRAQIEKDLGFPLLPGQQKIFQYFDMYDEEEQRIGSIIAASQKGEYGAIEFVVGFGVDGKIRNLYIQRSRERNRFFKKREFLDLFVGQSIAPIETLENLYKGEKNAGTQAIIQGLIKEFICYKILLE